MIRNICMKIKVLFVALIGLLLAVGLVLAGCQKDDGGAENIYPKTLTITGMNTHNGKDVIVFLSAAYDYQQAIANGRGTVTSGKITFDLKQGSSLSSGNNWTGSGNYYIFLIIEESGNYYISLIGGQGEGAEKEKMYVYTNGVTPNQDGSNVPKYSFLDTTTIAIIGLDKFYDVSSLMRNNSLKI